MDIEAARKRSERKLMGLPNVIGVGIGQDRGEQVLKVFVTHKLPESSLRPEDIVPRTIEGYRTDVEAIGEIVAHPG